MLPNIRRRRSLSVDLVFLAKRRITNAAENCERRVSLLFVLVSGVELFICQNTCSYVHICVSVCFYVGMFCGIACHLIKLGFIGWTTCLLCRITAHNCLCFSLQADDFHKSHKRINLLQIYFVLNSGLSFQLWWKRTRSVDAEVTIGVILSNVGRMWCWSHALRMHVIFQKLV